MASTAHGLLQTTATSTAQTAAIQNSQLNNTKTTFQTAMGSNATASCGAAGGGFLVYWTFTNDTISTSAVTNAEVNRGLGISNSTGTAADITFNLINQTSMSGIIGGLSGEIIIFSGEPFSDDVGDLDPFGIYWCRPTEKAKTKIKKKRR